MFWVAEKGCFVMEILKIHDTVFGTQQCEKAGKLWGNFKKGWVCQRDG